MLAHLHAASALMAELRPFLDSMTGLTGNPLVASSSENFSDNNDAASRSRLHAAMYANVEQLASDDDLRRHKTADFEWYDNHKECLSAKQFEAVCAYYRDGLTEEQVALTLRISRAAVSERLGRAKIKREQTEAKLREELFCLTRRNPD
jgi:predicted DNA-binding protein YlxM (UPF0122 family)